MAAMNADEVHDFLTPDEEIRWLRSLAHHLLETTKSIRPLTREEILDRLAIVREFGCTASTVSLHAECLRESAAA